MIKILMPKVYCTPEVMASSHLQNDELEAFAASGLQCVIYTPTPTRGVIKEIRNEYKKHKHEFLHDGKIEICRFSLYGEGTNPLLRAFRYFLFCAISLNKCLFGKESKECNVLFSVSTPPIIGAMSALVKKWRKIPFVYNLQDISPDSLVGTGLAKKGGILWKIGRVIENFTYRNADKIIVISEDFKRNIMAKGVPEEKIEVIYNWVDENAVVPVDKGENPLYEEFGISREKFTVVYAGNLGNAQNIGIIMDAARALKGNEGIQFVIFGKGGLEDEIKQAREREHLENLMILPLQPFERVSQVYGLGDVCIVACKPGLGGAAMPSKTWSIMSSGRAVLANFDEGELKNILEGCYDNPSTCSGRADDDNKVGACGVFTKAGDLEGFVSAIERLSQNPALCARMGRNGREFILRNLTKEVGTRKYVEVIKGCANDNDDEVKNR